MSIISNMRVSAMCMGVCREHFFNAFFVCFVEELLFLFCFAAINL